MEYIEKEWGYKMVNHGYALYPIDNVDFKFGIVDNGKIAKHICECHNEYIKSTKS